MMYVFFFTSPWQPHMKALLFSLFLLMQGMTLQISTYIFSIDSVISDHIFCFVLIDWQASFFAACGPLLAQIEPTKEPDSPGLLQKLAERIRYFRKKKKKSVDDWMRFIHKSRLKLFVNDQEIIRIVKIFSLISLLVSKSLHNNIFACVLYVLCCFNLTGQQEVKSWQLGS